MTPEQRARQNIDRMLEAAGWSVQSLAELDFTASVGVAVREFQTSAGPADYMLFVKRKPVGVLEAKPEGTTLSSVSEQTAKYLSAVPANLQNVALPLPFGFESTGVETFFRDLRDPDSRSRRVYAIHRPETLLEWTLEPDTLRSRLRALPPLETRGLRDCQTEGIGGLERSLAEARPRALIQMATGAGKTFTAISSIYRLIKFGGARRVVFLVDRSNLGRQTLTEFQQYVTPDDGRKFTELYNVQLLESNRIDPVAKVVVTTIQRLYSMLRGEAEFDASAEERSLHEGQLEGARPVEVAYNPDIPPETFDVVFTDECHRSIYNVWRQALEYFDAFLIGLTATPSKQTLGFFNQNLVTEYPFERSVADGVNVGYDVYRIRTQVSEQGGKVEAGDFVDRRDKLTRALRWEVLDEDLTYSSRDLDRSVVVGDQIRTVIRAFKDALPKLFPDRTEVPKTLVFAKDDSHAEDIVIMMREEFGKGNDFAKKITYQADKPEELVKQFRTAYYPRIAVTVDMISTGTDIKPLECLLFMRDVKSSLYFAQMKGRGTRTIDPNELKAVTPDASHKTRFVLVDAVGVTETDKTDMRPLERKKGVSFEKLVQAVQLGQRGDDYLTSLAGRLAKLDRELDPQDRQELETQAGTRMTAIVGALLDATDPDTHLERARLETGQPEPTEADIKRAAETVREEACLPFDNSSFRNLLFSVHKRNDQTLDATTKDTVLSAGYDASAHERAQAAVQSFRAYLDEHRDEVTAFQLLYERPYRDRLATFEDVKRLASGIARPPYNLTPERLWTAYEELERARVRGAGAQKLLTNLVSLVRFALQETDTLEPFPDTVERRFQAWLSRQELEGRMFTPEQREWLTLIKDRLADSLEVNPADLEYEPFADKGGPYRALKLFGKGLEPLLEELRRELVA